MRGEVSELPLGSIMIPLLSSELDPRHRHACGKDAYPPENPRNHWRSLAVAGHRRSQGWWRALASARSRDYYHPSNEGRSQQEAGVWRESKMIDLA